MMTMFCFWLNHPFNLHVCCMLEHILNNRQKICNLHLKKQKNDLITFDLSGFLEEKELWTGAAHPQWLCWDIHCFDALRVVHSMLYTHGFQLGSLTLERDTGDTHRQSHQVQSTTTILPAEVIQHLFMGCFWTVFDGSE